MEMGWMMVLASMELQFTRHQEVLAFMVMMNFLIERILLNLEATVLPGRGVKVPTSILKTEAVTQVEAILVSLDTNCLQVG